MNYWRIVRDNLEESVALTAGFFPIITYIEKNAMKMDDEGYLISRLWNTGNNIFAIPLVLYGKSIYRRICHIPHDAIAPVHDIIYGGTMCFAVKAIGYEMVGKENALWDSLWISALAGAAAPAGFYFVDVFKDLIGKTPIHESRKRTDTTSPFSKRLAGFEDWLTSKPQLVKRKIAYALIAGLLLTGGAVWYDAPHHESKAASLEEITGN